MTPRLQLIARQMDRREQQQAPAPEVPSGIGGAIEAMIEQAVEERVTQALAAQKQMLAEQQPKPRFDDFRQIPPVQSTRAPKAMQGTVQRDGAGVARAMVINGQRFLLQRDAAGQLVGFVDEQQASEVSYNGQPVPPAKLNRPRKLYGNDPEV
ncbi:MULTISPECIES: hypothetical protein [unclassified Pseudomonas]|uniref:Uncharacterized protein n=1 Tax=Pseudomonas sp. 13.2 TaxID=3144665 RepID=A0AAU7BEW0_9PSED|nr:hypothetical protein [Pseudomonas sp. SWI36]